MFLVSKASINVPLCIIHLYCCYSLLLFSNHSVIPNLYSTTTINNAHIILCWVYFIFFYTMLPLLYFRSWIYYCNKFDKTIKNLAPDPHMFAFPQGCFLGISQLCVFFRLMESLAHVPCLTLPPTLSIS